MDPLRREREEHRCGNSLTPGSTYIYIFLGDRNFHFILKLSHIHVFNLNYVVNVQTILIEIKSFKIRVSMNLNGLDFFLN